MRERKLYKYVQVLGGNAFYSNMLLCQSLSCVRLLRPQGLQDARLLCPWDPPGTNTGGIFHTQGSNPGLLGSHRRWILLNFIFIFYDFMASLVAQSVKNLPAVQETQVQFLGWEDPLEKEMATHSSILAWRIPWTEEPGRLQSLGSQESDTTQ